MARAGITVRITDLPEFHELVALVKDLREGLCLAMSEGWDSFSSSTQEELSNLVERIDGLAREEVAAQDGPDL